MTSFPLEIDDDEVIVRGICYPYHVSDGGKLKREAFEPPRGKNDVSVMRHDWIGTEVCRNRARSLAKNEKIYFGMAVLEASQIRSIDEVDIVDSRDQFEGHADIMFAGPTKDVSSEPLPASIQHPFKKKSKRLADSAKFFKDPNPDSDTWQGDPLCPAETDGI